MKAEDWFQKRIEELKRKWGTMFSVLERNITEDGYELHWKRATFPEVFVYSYFHKRVNLLQERVGKHGWEVTDYNNHVFGYDERLKEETFVISDGSTFIDWELETNGKRLILNLHIQEELRCYKETIHFLAKEIQKWILDDLPERMFFVTNQLLFGYNPQLIRAFPENEQKKEMKNLLLSNVSYYFEEKETKQWIAEHPFVTVGDLLQTYAESSVTEVMEKDIERAVNRVKKLCGMIDKTIKKDIK